MVHPFYVVGVHNLLWLVHSNTFSFLLSWLVMGIGDRSAWSGLVRDLRAACTHCFVDLTKDAVTANTTTAQNNFYITKIDRLEGVFLQARKIGVKALEVSSGSVRIQALIMNRTAVTNIVHSAMSSFLILNHCYHGVGRHLQLWDCH